MSKVYLVTGCSSGLGYHLAKAILSAGHKLIATSRTPSKTPDIVAEIQKLGGHWAELDVTSPMLESQFKEVVKVYGAVDVLINNAGVATGATVEQMDMDEARLILETNFFGAMRLTQLSIPLMRHQGSGTIVNISSGSTLNPVPMIAVYAASKFAIEGFTEALKKELVAFNIRVILAHPGEMRTSFIGTAHVTVPKEEYKGTAAEFVYQFLQSRAGKESADPEKVARAIVEAVDGTGLYEKLAGQDYLRLPLGSEVFDSLKQRKNELVQTLEDFDGISQSVDFKD